MQEEPRKWNTNQRFYAIRLIFVFFMINSSVANADYSTLYSDDQLFNKGREAYSKNKNKEASSYLFAYIQRNPSQMRSNPRHKRQVLEAIQFALEGVKLPAGTIGIIRAPKLDKLPRTNGRNTSTVTSIKIPEEAKQGKKVLIYAKKITNEDKQKLQEYIKNFIGKDTCYVNNKMECRF